jgi:hypothetical protein
VIASPWTEVEEPSMSFPPLGVGGGVGGMVERCAARGRRAGGSAARLGAGTRDAAEGRPNLVWYHESE